MEQTRNKAIRMGGNDRDPRKMIYLAGGGVALLVGVLALVISLSGEEEVISVEKGCRDDNACGKGRVCLKRGCLPLLKSEHSGLWHDEVSAQLNAQTSWEPRSYPGEKLSSKLTCPAKGGDVPEPPEDKVTVASKINVFEPRGNHVRYYLHQRTQGNVWIDAMRIYFPHKTAIDSSSICSSEDVVVVKNGVDDKKRPFVDASLKNAAPAGAVAKGAVAVRITPLEHNGARRLTFGLEPFYGQDKRYRTVFTVPLGADVIGIDGAQPSEQRLLSGHVAYYFDHSPKVSEATVTYKLNGDTTQPLNYAEISP